MSSFSRFGPQQGEQDRIYRVTLNSVNEMLFERIDQDGRRLQFAVTTSPISTCRAFTKELCGGFVLGGPPVYDESLCSFAFPGLLITRFRTAAEEYNRRPRRKVGNMLWGQLIILWSGGGSQRHWVWDYVQYADHGRRLELTDKGKSWDKMMDQNES